MNIFTQFIYEYGTTVLYAILTALAGYIGIWLKSLYTKYVNDKTKQDVVKTCVKRLSSYTKTYTVRRNTTRLLNPLLKCLRKKVLQSPNLN